MLGPIDYVAVGFKGSNFDGSILDEVTKAVKNGTIRVIDLLFILKDKNGNVMGGELGDQAPEMKKVLDSLQVEDDLPLLTEEDMVKLAAEMEPDSAAGVMVIEHLWAKSLKRAVLDSGGFHIADGRILPETADAALKELQMESAR